MDIFTFHKEKLTSESTSFQNPKTYISTSTLPFYLHYVKTNICKTAEEFFFQKFLIIEIVYMKNGIIQNYYFSS